MRIGVGAGRLQNADVGEAEEELDLPTCFVQLCDGQRRQREIVCKEDQSAVWVRIVEFDSAQRFRVGLHRNEM